ncbi:winged helix-turn-helix domain-containing protein [Budvicia diplopodorum]|uniref:winged helix-turn-helix domain-containing protein n=1 Tax=Budvicia diplopodorum TaxID=1119056 RepID=UPI0013584C79|nr:winged helix-turn-helix domain-containing protein [Budvicia diplopodorum]
MIYLIQNQVSYNSEDRTLKRLGDELSLITLSNIPARLLCYFLMNPGSVISRDTLLEEIWDKYGLVSSNNNLNFYVSFLRKEMLKLGLEKSLIITIPKVGFEFSGTVSPMTMDNSPSLNISEKGNVIDDRTVLKGNSLKINILYEISICIDIDKGEI